MPGSGFDGSGATPGWWADVLWVVGICWLIAGGQMPDCFPCFPFGECELVGRMWKACGGVTKLFSFSNLFFPIFFYILSLVSRRCGWGRSFNVWNSSFRSKNGELGRSVGVWNRLSAPWTCLFRQLKIVHGANQREPRVLFSNEARVPNAERPPPSTAT